MFVPPAADKCAEVSDIPRLVKLTDEELKGASEYEKRKALWLRYAFTKKRPTIEDADSGKDGARK